MTVKLEMPDGRTLEEKLEYGEVKRISLAERQEAEAEITLARGFDMGEGPGHAVKSTIMGGIGGVLLDARGRPLKLPEDDDARKEMLLKWFMALELYPEEDLKELV